MVSAPVGPADIEAARGRIAAVVRRTPLWPSRSLAELTGGEVWLKCENLQRTGSFKIRGAANMLVLRRPAGGVVAASAGNHAQGVALAAGNLGLPATVVMPRSAPRAKQRATQGYGATVELVDDGLDEAVARALALAGERRLLFVPPFDDPAVVAGQGTVALEVIEDCPDVETLVVPAGGGGLLAGMAMAVKARRPETRVIGVQAAAVAGIVASRAAGRVVRVEGRHTIADGVAVAAPSELTFELIQRYVDDVVSVSEQEIARAVLFAIERSRLVVEGAGALAVAALLSGVVEARGSVVAVLSGGNIDVNQVGRLIERGLLHDGRDRRITVAAADVPGELARVTAAVAAGGANVMDVHHDLVAPELPVGVARVTLRVELDGAQGYEALVDRMLAEGFVRGDATDLATPAAARYVD